MDNSFNEGSFNAGLESGLDHPEAGSIDPLLDPAKIEQLSSERGGIVTARGTADGLVLRLDGRVEGPTLKSALADFLTSRQSFLTGNPVALEWVGAKPTEEFIAEVSALLTDSYNIKVRASRVREVRRPVGSGESKSVDSIGVVREITGAKDKVMNDADTALGLFGGVEGIGLADDEIVAKGLADEKSGGNESFLWDDPDARLVYATLRSGQKIETEHSLVIFGDVNSGAEIVAGGDIVVLGTLRGVAHAGAYDETGGGRGIFALSLAPTQLRIGSIISRGSSEGQRAPEIARVEANMIVVEPYNSKNFTFKRRS
ncbi:MAG: hypothetical protein K1X83_11140 [Oligoflexia bacterium]|nr:hypothetical protein [Oligoflexia bacterium]